ncbi:hypothetical protein K466DRAFT_600722 [Polyporus arcularius HHB13444]|uniref:Uncharacterized protein n=1 Tax=Polyporus arcularius HHB13444 TaxID=1314778 RepID=A0A5C3PCM4_9APHY|nr:hypothetical protein K466DRAFT_600722 [Polyporus arcularius HHB13444]
MVSLLKIAQGNALYDYRLSPKDLKGLEHTQETAPSSVMHGHERHFYYKYKERDVLARASAASEILKRRRTAVARNPVEFTASDEHVPRDYRRGRFYDITKDFFIPPPGHFYRRLPPAHQSAYNTLGPQRRVVPAPAPTPVMRRPEADAALATAVEFFTAYPARPARPLKRSSRPIARVLEEMRSVLRQAPAAPRRGTAAWGAAAERLECMDEPAPGHYRWSAAYFECVFAALCALIERDPSAWEGFRWEIYDKYVASVSLRAAVRYDALQESWTDAAAEWLSVQVPPDGLRGTCASGQRYDELLGERVLP